MLLSGGLGQAPVPMYIEASRALQQGLFSYYPTLKRMNFVSARGE
jgi:hypothetical protein